MIISCIAIDDEPKALKVIELHSQKLDAIQLLESFTDAKKGLAFLKQNPVEILLLDINMPHLSGLDVLDALQIKPKVIFTTAYPEFALESYNYNAVDYLLKPFEFDRFQIAINKAIQQIEADKEQHKFFFIKDGFKNIKINFSDILFIKGSGNYLDIHTPTKVFSPRMTFVEISQKLPIYNFVRIHQSYIINFEKILKIENNHVFIGEDKIPISSNYKKLFFKRLEL